MHTDVHVQEKTFTLPESATIMRYVATTQGVPDHWYPSRHADFSESCCQNQYACLPDAKT